MPERKPHHLRRPHSRSSPLPQHALDDLRFIRETMERSSSFTATPGWGQVAMGLTALAASAITAPQTTPKARLAVWLIEASLAIAIAVPAMCRKARRAGLPLTSGPGRKVALTFLPSVFTAMILSAALYRLGLTRLLPGIWALCYGAGILSGGAFSIPLLPAMGLCFLTTGAIALFIPAFGNLLLAVSFGGFHILFGLWIAKYHGG
jgi:hypothetical protein